MPRQRPQLLVSCCLAIAMLSAAGVVAMQDWLPAEGVAARRLEFQSLVGGLGFGSSVDLAQCVFSFDPRLQPNCSHLLGPIPGGSYLCPKHMGRATGYPHLLPAQSFPVPSLDADESDHATIR
jgi:hypothetical protein